MAAAPDMIAVAAGVPVATALVDVMGPDTTAVTLVGVKGISEAAGSVERADTEVCTIVRSVTPVVWGPPLEAPPQAARTGTRVRINSNRIFVCFN